MTERNYPRGDLSAPELSAMLASRAEEVCRAYLPGGKREGGYFRVGSVGGEAGQSLWVQLRSDDRGRWKDEAEPDQGGDLLDLIRASKRCTMPAALDEAARFLGLAPAPRRGKAFGNMLRDARPVTPEDPAGLYLAGRGLDAADAEGCMFHPALWVRVDEAVREEPALIVPLTTADGTLHAMHRIFVAQDGGKPDFERHKRTSGSGNGIAARFGPPDAERVVLCEGVEDALAVVRVLGPDDRAGVAAAPGAGRLAGIELHPAVRRVLHMRDRDAAGDRAWEALRERWADGHIAVMGAQPQEKDANAELLAHGPEVLRGLLDPLFAEEEDVTGEADAGVGEGGPGREEWPEALEEGGGGKGIAVGEQADRAEWTVFIRDWNEFHDKAGEAEIHPSAAPGYGPLVLRMRVLAMRDGIEDEARRWLSRQLAGHNAGEGRRKRTEELVLSLRIIADRRRAVEECAGEILRSPSYGEWKAEEARLAETGAAILVDDDYEPALDGVAYSREWIRWAEEAVPAWHAEDAERLQAIQDASVRR